MRIVGGRFRGHRLASPGAAGGGAAALRPTTDRNRESLFNILEHGHGGLEGLRVLDLFAGTGALGFEALSRGAVHATFVDDLPAARALIRDGVDRLGLTGVTKIWRRDATRLGPCRGAPFDLVFLDPPYARGLGERALAAALEGGWAAPGALAVWEEAATAEVAPPPGATVLDERRWGDSAVRLLRLP